MVSQYPYDLYVYGHDVAAVKNSNGNYTGVNGDWLLIGKCRDQANSGGKLVQLADGKQVTYSYLINLPLNTPTLASKATVQVRDGDTVRLTGSVLSFRVDQLHCRLWL